MPTQVEGPPSSRLRSKTKKNNLVKKQNHQDPPERNRTPMDPPNINHEVNQVQTARNPNRGIQVLLPLTLIGILLLINVFFYFRL